MKLSYSFFSLSYVAQNVAQSTGNMRRSANTLGTRMQEGTTKSTLTPSSTLALTLTR